MKIQDEGAYPSNPLPEQPENEAQSAHRGDERIQLRSIADIEVHPLNDELYRHGPLDAALKESIEERGIINPLVVNAAGRLISGHRRLEAARSLGMTKVPVIVHEDLVEDDDSERALLDANLQRVKTNEQRLREFACYLKLEEAAAANRRGKRSDLRGKSPTGSEGRARDFAARRVGLSGETAMQGLAVVKQLDTHTTSGEEQERVEELRITLNQSVNAAHKLLRQWGWLPNPLRKKKAQSDESSAISTATNDHPAALASSADRPQLPFEDETHAQSDDDEDGADCEIGRGRPAHSVSAPNPWPDSLPSQSAAAGEFCAVPATADCDTQTALFTLVDGTSLLITDLVDSWISAAALQSHLRSIVTNNSAIVNGTALNNEVLASRQRLVAGMMKVINGSLAHVDPDLRRRIATEALDGLRNLIATR